MMSPDAKLQRDILAELNFDPRVLAGHIGVIAEAGMVTLTGHTENYPCKTAAEQAVRRVKGVRGVTDEITVQLGHVGARTDEDITTAVVNRLSWDATIAQRSITPTVEHGRVKLTGQVDWRFEADAAVKVAERTIGVVGVSNELTVKPRIDVESVEDAITHALHRSWLFDPKLVTVSAVDGIVTLAGTVPNRHDRQVAENIAWASPGAVDVENGILVTA